MINPSSVIAAEILATGRSRAPIIDMHAHMFNFGGAYMIADTPAKQITAMDRSNVRLATIVGHRGLMEKREGYLSDLEAFRAFPDRFRVYYPVITQLPDPDRDFELFEAHPEIVGFKFHPDDYGLPLSDERNAPYLAYASEHHLPCLCHTWGGSPNDDGEQVLTTISKYPGLTFIAGHSFRDKPEEAVMVASELPNVYLELTAVMSQRDRIEPFLEAGFIDRIVFGADAPWFSYDAYIGALLDVGLSDDELEKIFYKNALAIYDKAGLNVRPLVLGK